MTMEGKYTVSNSAALHLTKFPGNVPLSPATKIRHNCHPTSPPTLVPDWILLILHFSIFSTSLFFFLFSSRNTLNMSTWFRCEAFSSQQIRRSLGFNVARRNICRSFEGGHRFILRDGSPWFIVATWFMFRNSFAATNAARSQCAQCAQCKFTIRLYDVFLHSIPHCCPYTLRVELSSKWDCSLQMATRPTSPLYMGGVIL